MKTIEITRKADCDVRIYYRKGMEQNWSSQLYCGRQRVNEDRGITFQRMQSALNRFRKSGLYTVSMYTKGIYG